MALTTTQYDEIMHTYYENQTANRAMEQERKQIVYAKVPRIEEIDQAIAQSSIRATRDKLLGRGDAILTTKEKNAELIAEKTRLLKENGFDENYLQPIFTCPLCQDTGRTDNGYCTCFEQASLSYLYRQSTLEKILSVENFETFQLEFYSKEADGVHPFTPYDNMRKILEKVHLFIESFDKDGGNLLFYGETGLGKTFLSNCIAKALLDTRHTVLYQSSIHLFEDVCADVIMKKGELPGSQETYRYLYDCDLLVIDDLGTEYTNSFVSSQLYDILNTRMREKKSTLISTNLNLQELAKRYSDRIISRIVSEYQVYHFYGNNIRLAKRKSNL